MRGVAGALGRRGLGCKNRLGQGIVVDDCYDLMMLRWKPVMSNVLDTEPGSALLISERNDKTWSFLNHFYSQRVCFLKDFACTYSFIFASVPNSLSVGCSPLQTRKSSRYQARCCQ